MSDITAGGLSKASLPTVLVSSKCDKPTKTWEVDHEMVEELTDNFRRVESFQTSATAPETHKRCISVILRNISSKRSRKSTRARSTYIALTSRCMLVHCPPYTLPSIS